MDGRNRNRQTAEDDAMKTSETLTGKRDREPADVVEISGESAGSRGERCHMGDLHLALDADTGVAKEHALSRYPDLKARWDATHASLAERVDAATSAWIAGERDRVSGQELTEEYKVRGALASAA